MFNLLKKHKTLILEILAIILIIIYAISLSPKTMQNDTYYTVTIGKLITENGIDMQDHFSWHEGLPYTYPHWLYDVMMYHIYNAGGWTGIYISTCTFAAILGICIYIVNSRLTGNKLISFLVTIGSLYLLQGYITARAQLVTFILFILLIYNIERFLKTKHIHNAILLILIHIFIANLHVAVWPFTFVLYLPYIGEYLICELVELILYRKIKLFFLKRRLKIFERKGRSTEILENKIANIEQKVERVKAKREENLKEPYKIKLEKNTNTRWLILIMIIAIFTGLCTPLGKTPYSYTYLTLQSNEMQHINEHLPMTLYENAKVLCTIVLFLAILTFTKAKIKLSDLFMLGGLTYLMLMSRRQSSMFALIGSLVLSRMVVDMVKIYVKNTKHLLSVAGVAITILVVSMSINNYKGKENNAYISQSSYPVEAAEWILENLDLENIRLYNEYNFGSYLLYRGIPVFIDSRADLYAPEFNTDTGDSEDGRDIFSDFINSSNIGTYYGKIFEKYDITHIIVKANSKINMLIKNADSEKYELLYSDKYFVIYRILEY